MLVALSVLLALGGSARAGGLVSGCTEQALRDALVGGGVVTFTSDCSLTLSQGINLPTNSTTIDGGGFAVTISGGNGVPLFNVTGSLRLVGLTLADGKSPNGGAVYVNPGATFVATNCTFTGNIAQGTAGAAGANGSNATDGTGGNGGNGTSGTAGLGGAIYNYLGNVGLLNCTFITNSALGGNGGNGGSGGNGGGSFSQGGNGGNAGNGAAGSGGAVYNQGNLSLFNCTLSSNNAQGGNGGIGGTNGSGVFVSLAGSGGAGATGAGGAIYNGRNTTIIACTFSGNTAVGGTSAPGGNRTSGIGTAGNRGGDGIGGALCSLWWGAVTNCTFFNNTVTGGDGGDGGGGTGTLDQGGNGGDGGNGYGGGIENEGTLTVVNCTIANGAATAGTNGVSGSGDFAGTDGLPGKALGGGVARTAGTFALLNCILATNTPGANGYGTVTDEGYNISSDSSIVLNTTSRASLDPRLGTLTTNGGPTMTMALLSGSPAIDFIPTSQNGFPATDQRGVRRPQGLGVDAGAFEHTTTGITPPAFSLLQPSLSTNGIAIAFPTASGFNYVLQYKNTLTDAVWSVVSTNPGTGGFITNQDQATNVPGRFYRVLAQ